MVLDDFCHEQNLIISTEKEKVLISGCSHAGIVNIQNKAEQIVAVSLKQKGSIYYTGHCTGPKAYKRMKAVMGDKINYLSTGTEIER